MAISDLKVEPFGGDLFRASWSAEGARFHVHFKPDAAKPDKPVLYKNPPRDIEFKAPGYFKTVHMNANAKANARVIAAVLARVRDEGLVQAAQDTARAAERVRVSAITRENRLRDLPKLIAEEALRLYEAGAFRGASADLAKLCAELAALRLPA